MECDAVLGEIESAVPDAIMLGMKSCLLAAFIFLLPNISPAEKAKIITAKELKEATVIGSLGVPLGRTARIRATIASGNELRSKGYRDRYLLKIISVNDQVLAEAVVIEFSCLSLSNLQIPNDLSGLRKTKLGSDDGPITPDAQRELERNLVGSEVSLLGYETGGFEGIPDDLPDNFPRWQARGYHFRTRIVVIGKP